MRTRIWLTLLAAVALAGLGLAVLGGCGDDSSPTQPGSDVIPQAWGGIWDLQWVQKDCLTDSVIDTFTEIDTICAGRTVGQEFDLSPLAPYCPGVAPVITDTQLTLSCSHSGQVDPYCNYSVTAGANITLNSSAGTLGGSVRVQSTFNPANCGNGQCVEFVVAGTRLSTDQTGCPTGKTGGFFAPLAVRRP
jgi:hypothetical protein